MRRIGLVVNPIAGMGGRPGLKGTDGVVEEARAAGAEPIAGGRARRFAATYRSIPQKETAGPVRWVTAAGAMGSESLLAAGVPETDLEIIDDPAEPTTAVDTARAVERAVAAGAELILFCGGDGTARDVAAATKDRVPILGIPCGVKMHSGIFAVSPEAAAELLAAYLRGSLRVASAEILDLDEVAYRSGEWRVRMYGTAKTLVEPHLVQAGKLQVAEVSDESVRSELAEHFRELFAENPDTLFLLGPGSTLASIATALDIEKTLLGIDAVLGGHTIARDLNERRILDLLENHPKAKVVVSPIGAQGFILGRGNLELSPAVLRRIGTKNLLVVGTPAKLELTPVLRVDTGDPSLDREIRMREYLFVLVGYRTSKLHPLQS